MEDVPDAALHRVLTDGAVRDYQALFESSPRDGQSLELAAIRRQPAALYQRPLHHAAACSFRQRVVLWAFEDAVRLLRGRVSGDSAAKHVLEPPLVVGAAYAVVVQLQAAPPLLRAFFDQYPSESKALPG
ncbi:hypothetical protein ANO11243_067400 [Dothideomycetidae sp. 11243]|nr:hypothetical protein ANO11243_067400 [fungal sp. No.11243]